MTMTKLTKIIMMTSFTETEEKIDLAIIEPGRSDTNQVETGLVVIGIVILLLGVSSGFQLFLSSSLPSVGFRSLQSQNQFPDFVSRFYSR